MNAQRIQANEFLTRQQHGPVSVVDLRTQAEAASESFAGSVCLPVQELTQEQIDEELAKAGDKSVYLLCRTGRRADLALNKLDPACHSRLVVLEGGLEAIKAAGGEVSIGEKVVMDLERQVRIAAGTLVVLGCALGMLVHPSLYGISAFVGAGLIFAGVTNTCGMGLLIARMPWNR